MIAPGFEKPTVSVIIPTHNRGSLIHEVIEPLWKQTAASQIAEIIVVDNCSTDDTEQRVRALAEKSPCPLRYHRMPCDRGPSVSRNAGARLATSTLIGFLDSDVVLDSRWMEFTLDRLARDPTIGMIGGKLVYASRPDRLNSYGGDMGWIGLGWDHQEGGSSDRATEPHECLWIPTAAVLIRRSLFDSLGGFDEAFYLFFEDSDFGWRLNLAGFRCVCIPEAVAFHNIVDGRAELGAFLTFHACKNRLRSLIRNCGLPRLAAFLPLYLGYAATDAVVRSPRLPKLRALWWNVLELGDTLRKRVETQRARRARDSDIAHLFSPRLFPPERRGNRRRRLTGGHA